MDYELIGNILYGWKLLSRHIALEATIEMSNVVFRAVYPIFTGITKAELVKAVLNSQSYAVESATKLCLELITLGHLSKDGSYYDHW